jgi:asparagine synthase (glutamine-hydrolysing)
MCAIAGIVMRDGGPADPGIAERMGAAMRHRGPDGGGVRARGRAALGHRRLKIIDLSDRAAQPMVSLDGRFTIVFNGEIYNYRDLRRQLASRGHRFQSDSDTEVLLGLYADFESRLLDHVEGIFAFAVWDERNQSLYAARDRMGVKPFYYAMDRDRLLFASEAKALFAGGWRAEVEASRVPEHLAFGYVAGESTLFQGVRRLEPGHWLRLAADGELEIRRYFSALRDGPQASLSFSEAARAVGDMLDAAVERQLVSDVPIGCTCSGGLDSSAITALVAARVDRLDTYCARIQVPGCDETSESRLVSSNAGTTHHEISCDTEDLVRSLAALTWMHDEPLKFRAALPTYLVARLARREVTVLFSGEGSDELFGGYGYYHGARLVDDLRRHCPRAVLRALRRFRPHAAAAALGEDREELILRLRGIAEPDQLQALVPDIAPEWEERRERARKAIESADGDLLQAAMFYDQTTLLPSVLAHQDRMSMAASIETRVPFLDREVVSLANSLPSDFKLRNGKEKAVLRAALAETLPPPIVRRRKHAFDVPLSDWMRQECSALTRDLADGVLVKAGLVSRSSVERLVPRLVSPRAPSGPHLLWNLLTLETWWSVFITRDPVHTGRLPMEEWMAAPFEEALQV